MTLKTFKIDEILEQKFKDKNFSGKISLLIQIPIILVLLWMVLLMDG